MQLTKPRAQNGEVVEKNGSLDCNFLKNFEIVGWLAWGTTFLMYYVPQYSQVLNFCISLDFFALIDFFYSIIHYKQKTAQNSSKGSSSLVENS